MSTNNMNNKIDFNINGNIVTSGNLSVAGNLDVKGTTNTINQETLTIKDNFIAVNGNGTTLDTAGMAGVVAITGGENPMLKDGTYYLDAQALVNALNIRIVDDPNNYFAGIAGPYSLVADETAIQRFNNLNLVTYFVDDGSSLYVSVIKSGPTYYLNGVMSTFAAPSGVFDESRDKGHLEVFEVETPIVTKNQIIKQEDINFLCSFLKHAGGSKVTPSEFNVFGAQAYAAPIYDKSSDSLKIGLGNYLKDENGNITGFEFGGGLGLNIATRADDLSRDSLIVYNESTHELENDKTIETKPGYFRLKGLIDSLSLVMSGGYSNAMNVTLSDNGNSTSIFSGAVKINNNWIQPNSLVSSNVFATLPEESGTIATREWVNAQGFGGGGNKLYKHNTAMMIDGAPIHIITLSRDSESLERLNIDGSVDITSLEEYLENSIIESGTCYIHGSNHPAFLVRGTPYIFCFEIQNNNGKEEMIPHISLYYGATQVTDTVTEF